MAGYYNVIPRKVWVLMRVIRDQDGNLLDSDLLGVFAQEELATYNMAQYAVKFSGDSPITLLSEHIMQFEKAGKIVKLWTSESDLNQIDQYYADGNDGIGD